MVDLLGYVDCKHAGNDQNDGGGSERDWLCETHGDLLMRRTLM